MKNTNRIIYFIAIAIAILVIALWTPRIIGNIKANNQQKRIDKLLVEINNLYIENEQLQAEYDHIEDIQAQIHESAEENRAKIETLREEFMWLKQSDERQPWMLNESWDAQVMPELTSTTEHDRFKELALDYWLDPEMIRKVENYYWIKEWVVLCITIAETSWGNRWYWKANIWSVWSNDRWDRPTYALMETWLEWIGKTLTNKYLGKHQTLWCLSNAGHCNEWLTSRYATSEWNRERNMVWCLSSIYWEIDPATFSIRR